MPDNEPTVELTSFDAELLVDFVIQVFYSGHIVNQDEAWLALNPTVQKLLNFLEPEEGG